MYIYNSILHNIIIENTILHLLYKHYTYGYITSIYTQKKIRDYLQTDNPFVLRIV